MEEETLKGIVLLSIIFLFAGLAIGYIASPEYVNLEPFQISNYEAQIEEAKDLDQQHIEEWKTYTEQIEDQCEKDIGEAKAETAERLGERNRELIEANVGWQDLFADLNKTVSDLNKVLYDFNKSDLNC